MNDELKQDIFRIAHEVGFTLAGVTEPKILHPDKFRDWLGNDYAGSMAYMHNHLEKRLDPQKLVPGTQSILCLAVNYFQKPPEEFAPADGKIALYAWGRDYHLVIKEMLHTLAQKISELLSRKIRYRAFVDTGPVLEKVLA
jgi:epoxyqueuosine reductase